MPERKGKAVFVSLSSSEEEGEDEEEEEEEESEGDHVDDSDYDEDDDEDDEDEGDDDEDERDDDDGDEEEDVISISSGEDVTDEEADRESVDDDSEAMPGDEANCNRIIQLLQGGHDLNILKLEECKAYLRKHGLRLTGTKSICIQRIQEHWRIKDGNGEKLYPRSSFVINCRGDVCNGDTVLFTQRVYRKFDVVTRGSNPIGKRTIAGRVVKESYGAAKQQHTFTVEILWSKGVKTLPPLFPLLVKGRNLYRLKTFRQRWNDEAERLKVLAEKHKRGAAARRIRAIKKAGSANGGSNLKRHSRKTSAPPKRQKNQAEHSTKSQKHDACRGDGPSSGKTKAKRNSKARPPESSGSKRKRHPGNTRTPNKRQRNQETEPATGTQKRYIKHGKAPPSVLGETEKRLAKPRAVEESAGHLQHIYHGNGFSAPQPIVQNGPLHNHYHAQMQFHHRDVPTTFATGRGMHPFSNYELGSTSTAAQVCPNRLTAVPTHYPVFSGINHFSDAYMKSSSWFDPRSSSCLQTQVDVDRQLHTVPRGVQANIHKSGPLPCLTPGCKDLGAKSCVGSFCWTCCRRTGRRCQRHKLP
ncbi:zinc finger CCCH domain-containing protein 62-like isoform X2 [Magnolia sinica]|uniref:zinc finger CCCH domain-containing protein 62-like isoform X2 n=1 Tax=Magnolia sinica TaxID=86752 RepID=UPI002659B931|nr:zinc finger CCCH domain-containing protein 62-like isoform X2 [Magnolia sinica]